MRIHQLLGGVSVVITNEEKNFIQTHNDNVSISSLDDHETWVAQNLVRKNVYQLTKDSKNIVINRDHENKQSTI